MDREKKILICRGANDVRCEEERPRERRRVLKEICAEDLEKHNGKDSPFRPRLRSAELQHLLFVSNNAKLINWVDVTSGCALMIAWRRVRCGSSV